MLVKKPIDWNDLEVNRRRKYMFTKGELWLLFFVAVFLIVAVICFWYVINNMV